MDEGFIMDPKIMIQIVSIAVAMGGAWTYIELSNFEKYIIRPDLAPDYDGSYDDIDQVDD